MLEEVAMAPGEAGMIERARGGDADAFETIYREYQPRIAGYLRRMVGDPDLAADLTQDVFVNAYRGISRTQPGLSLKAWLFTIATNAAFSHHRRRRLLRWLPLPDSEGEPSAPGQEDRFAAREELGAAMAALPRDQAACLLLHLRDGFSYEEIGGMVGISAGAARVRACRARLALARALRTGEEGK
jgi:RNA polymerase sigma-70 factor (ECF subfamily)